MLFLKSFFLLNQWPLNAVGCWAKQSTRPTFYLSNFLFYCEDAKMMLCCVYCTERKLAHIQGRRSAESNSNVVQEPCSSLQFRDSIIVM